MEKGGVHGGGHAWLWHVWQGEEACLGGRGECVAGGMHGGGYVWWGEGGMCGRGRGYVWQGACMAGGMRGRVAWQERWPL